MSKQHPYHAAVRSLLEEIERTQLSAVRELAEKAASSIRKGGVLHFFGTGHSNMVAMEAFHRAGGLVPVGVVFDPQLLPFPSPAACRERERQTGVAARLLENHDVRKGEILVMVSNSGINPVPVEMAVEGKKRGLFTVALTSVAHSRQTPSRHAGGKRLFEVADLILDTCVPLGDASVVVDDAKGIRAAPLSGVAGLFIVNLLVCETARLLKAAGEPVPVFASNNVPSGESHNRTLEEKYKDRLKFH